MKIIQLMAENVKKLTAVQITPEGDVVQITGKNGQGKTSVLDSIWWALAGTANVQAQPIRKGADSARIELTLGKGEKVELIVERRFTEASSYLTVKTPEGARYPSPQKLLDDLLGTLTFDPLHFMRLDSRGQFDVLRSLVKLDVDIDDLDARNKTDFETRTTVNRDAKAKRAQALAVTVPVDLPPERIDEAKLLDQLTAASAHNADIERRKQARASLAASITRNRDQAASIESSTATFVRDIQFGCDEDVADIERQIEALQSRLEARKQKAAVEIEGVRAKRAAEATRLRNEADELQKKLDDAKELPEPIDVAALRTEIEQAQATNRHIEQRNKRKAIELEATALENRSEALTKAIDSRKQQKATAIAAAKMPIDGISFGDGTVIFNGLPLNQASDAEQLMVSTAIAAALNPKLRVLRIRDGSLLDQDAMQRLADFAKERDFQIWIERVDGSGTVGIVMEDGHVKGHEQPQREAAE